MGLTLIRKSDGTRPKKDPKVALVLAGGAVSGGAFKVGGLKALNDYLVDRRVTDFDVYVGLSAGAILGASLAAGVSPDEMVEVLDGTSTRLPQLKPTDFYQPNFQELIARPAKFFYDLATYMPGVYTDLLRGLPDLPRVLGPGARRFLKDPSYAHAEAVAMEFIEHISPTREIPALTNHIPTAPFTNVRLERWLRKCLQRLRLPNDFRAFERRRQRALYLTACDLDTAERVVFGPDENCDATISEAVRASTALPLFYAPARVNGIDYVDGGVRHTANIDLAVAKGADLIVCYNPFRPFLNRIDAEDGEAMYFADGRYLSDRGLKAVLNQVFRTLLHTRLILGLQRYLADDSFRGDIVLLEPREQDADFFGMNPLAFWRRAEAVQHGFESVRSTVDANFDELSSLFSRYGFEMSREAAQRRARRARSARGWRAEPRPLDPAEEGPEEAPPLRLVETKRR